VEKKARAHARASWEWLSAQSIAAAATTATTAAIGTLVAEFPRAILRVAWVGLGLRGQNGGEGEKRGESNKGERFHAWFPFGGAKIADSFALD